MSVHSSISEVLTDATLRSQGRILPSRLYAWDKAARGWSNISLPPGDSVGYWRRFLKARGFATLVVKEAA